MLTFVLVFLFFPETAGAAIENNDLGGLSAMSLEELSYIFGVRTSIHMQYQFKEVLCYEWKRHFLREKEIDKPVKLYKWPPHREQRLEDLESQEQELPMLNGAVQSVRHHSRR